MSKFDEQLKALEVFKENISKCHSYCYSYSCLEKPREKKSFKIYITVDVYINLRLESSFVAENHPHWHYDNITKEEIDRRNR